MSFKDILNEMDADSKARMGRKVPEWGGVEGLCFPTRLSMEQCSSSATARYKAELVSWIFTGCTDTAGVPRLRCSNPSSLRCGNASPVAHPPQSSKPVICDLTGGLGVDCWAFSRMACHVHHNEMSKELSAAVQANFSALGITNASFSSIEIIPGKVADVIAACGMNPDIIFLDPARRSGTGKKVFLLEDCSPDILTLKDELLGAAPDILVKLSPMADITMVCRRLGRNVREVHVVESDGECKELLVWLQRGWDGDFTVVYKDLLFTPAEEGAAVPSLLDDTDELSAQGFLFEPSSSLLKAGCFNLICGRFAMRKLGRFTHLYSSESCPEPLKNYGKLFRILKVLPFDGKTVKALEKEYPRCEVTARNLPISSDELRKR